MGRTLGLSSPGCAQTTGTPLAPTPPHNPQEATQLMSGHQHGKEPVHDLGQGQADKGEHEPGDKDKEAGGGRREHKASGSHESNIEGTHDNKKEHNTGTGRNRGGAQGD